MQTATPTSATRQSELQKLRQELLRLILKNEARRRITTK
jgi:hypothetical protein